MPKSLDRIAKSTVHLGVLARINGSGAAYSKTQISAAKANKWVLAYINVGQAQNFEWYWQKNWRVGKPKWILTRNKFYPSNFDVQLDSSEWLAITKKTLDKIMAAGFDGAMLDVLDVYWHATYPGKTSKANQQKAVKLACAIRNYTQKKSPGFKILVNNAVNLITDFPEYGACLDGTVGESVWYMTNDQWRGDNYTNYQVTKLRENLAFGKKVFTVDKALVPDHIGFVYTQSRLNGFIPFVGNGKLNEFPLKPGG